MRTRAEHLKAIAGQMPKPSFSHLTPSRISRAEKQDSWFAGHYFPNYLQREQATISSRSSNSNPSAKIDVYTVHSKTTCEVARDFLWPRAVAFSCVSQVIIPTSKISNKTPTIRMTLSKSASMNCTSCFDQALIART